jgi:hypothetical protein
MRVLASGSFSQGNPPSWSHPMSNWGWSRKGTVTARWKWLLTAAAVLTLTACGSNSAGQAKPTSPVTIHIKLDHTRVTAGMSIGGQAVLTNYTSKPITVEQCAADGWLAVGLVNKQIQFNPAYLLIACQPSIRLMPGFNRFPVTVITTYQQCQQPGAQSTTYVHPCIGSSGLPPLPAGTYKTKVVTVGLASSTMPRSIEVTVTVPH